MITIISSQDNEAGIKKAQEYDAEDRPESGLHPIHHAELAEDWIKRHLAGENVVVFTHAEIAMLRLLRRIEEEVIETTDVRFFVLATDQEIPSFIEMPVVINGQQNVDFRDNWPCKNGFFHERGNELFH